MMGRESLAVPVPHLNRAVVTVAERDDKTLQQALPDAFKQVLIKLTGNEAVIDSPIIQQALPQASTYMESYEYLPSSQLQMTFDLPALKKLLNSAGQSIWKNDRPLILLWITLPNGAQSQVIYTDTDAAELTALQNKANQRGAPILFPAMDLSSDAIQPLTTLPSNDTFATILQQYGAAGVLVGVLTQNDQGQVQGQWKLWLNHRAVEWQTNGDNVTAALERGIDHMTDVMAGQYNPSIVNNSMMDVTLSVHGIKGLQDYAHVMSMLKHLSGVNEVDVLDMTDNVVVFKVNVRGDQRALQQALQSITALTPKSSDSEFPADLAYDWNVST